MQTNRLTAQQRKTQLLLDGFSQNFKKFYARGEYEKALPYALRANRIVPRIAEPLGDAATCCVYLERWADAIAYGEQAILRKADQLNALDVLAHAHGALQQWDKAGEMGFRALQIRDAAVRQNHPVLPSLPEIVSRQGGAKIIAFSLYGNSSKYCEPAVMNSEVVVQVYPGWQCRFYVDDSVPAEILARLRANQAQVVMVDDAYRLWPGTMWRFLALADENAERILFRDADSVIDRREAAAVREWEESGRLFHMIRDAGSHTELILAGLWGAGWRGDAGYCCADP